MRSIIVLGSVCAVGAIAAGASGAPTFFDELGGGSILQPRDGTRIESRFRVDANNWDTRLEFDSDPETGDLTGAVANGTSFFEGETFGFELFYDHSEDEVTWTISGPDPATDVLNSLTQPTDTMGQLNTIQVFTNGSRGEVTITDLAFVGLSMDVLAWPDLDTAPSPAVRFKETFLFFGDAFDLLTDDWTLSGKIGFDNFTSANPSEGAKITVKLRNAEIPAPGAAAALGLGLLAGARRRR